MMGLLPCVKKKQRKKKGTGRSRGKSRSLKGKSDTSQNSSMSLFVYIGISKLHGPRQKDDKNEIFFILGENRYLE